MKKGSLEIMIKHITPQQLKEKLNIDKVKVLDVRSEEKFNKGHLKHPNAENIHIPKTEIFALEESDDQTDLPITADEEIIVTCTTGNSAARCTKILTEKGYRVTLLEGGMTAWNDSEN